jgi:dUTP pyrophosphatase
MFGKKMKMMVKPLRDGVVIPEYAHASDAGMDLFSTAAEGVIIDVGVQAAIPTGIAVAIPEGHVGIIMDKSGLAAKHGLKVMGGVIDAGYQGELTVMLLNAGRDRVAIKSSQKIAQMLIVPVVQASIEIGDLPAAKDDRGEGGFGSTGLKAKV